MIRARSLLPLALLLALAAPSSADPVEDLTRLVREASDTPNPAMAFLRGLAAMPDFKLNQAEIRRALEAAGVPASGLLRQLLGPTTRLVKQRDQVAIDRAKPTLVRVPGGGAVELGRRVTARLTVHGAHDATINELDGMRVGETHTDLYDLKKVRFTRQGGRPVALVTAGVLFFTKTVTIDLTPRPGSVPAGSPRAASPTVGLTGAVERTAR